MSPIAGIIIVLFIGWLWYDAIKTPITPADEDDDTTKFYHDETFRDTDNLN